MKDKIVLDGIKRNIQMEINTVFEKGYTQGSNDGYERGIKDGNINDGTFAEKVKEAYENGLNDAWEMARKIMLHSIGLHVNEVERIYGMCEYEVLHSLSASEAIEKLKAWKDETFKIGDEVKSDAFDDKGIITHITTDGAVAIISSGSSMMKVGKSGLHKTGRTFPEMAKMLKQMKEVKE